jgi:hypothetical protein
MNASVVHCKKELAVFPSPAGMSLIKLFLGGKNLVFSRPERVWSVTSRLETGKWLTPFYSVCVNLIEYESPKNHAFLHKNSFVFFIFIFFPHRQTPLVRPGFAIS